MIQDITTEKESLRINPKNLIRKYFKIKSKFPGKRLPKLPKIVKFSKEGNLFIKELNPNHTQSVFRGFKKRLNNYLNGKKLKN